MNINLSPLKTSNFQRMNDRKIVINGKRKIRKYKKKFKKLKRSCIRINYLFK